MTCVVCAIAKNEHLYINDWVKWYINLGFSHIYLYDNDDVNSKYVGDFIDKDYRDKITIINKRGIKEQGLQKKLYREFYMANKDNFDWCLFCDLDEYLFGIQDINKFVSNPAFNKFDQIRIQWKLFGDDDLVTRDMSKPIYECFKKPLDNHSLSNQGKAIIKGHLKEIYFNSVHYGAKDVNETILKSCLPSGVETRSKVEIDNYANEVVHLHHYMTKTISEFISQKYGRGDAIFKSREIDLSYFWNLNDKTDAKLKWLKEHDIIQDEIDLVIPYVDSSDSDWQKLFNEYNPEKAKQIESVNARNRFRGQGDFFRFWFRSIEKNMPWINRIHLIVQSESQVPKWLNRKRVNIVYHKDIIPEELLPVFNSTAIEMFIWNIPNLSEKFIYANDDFYANMPLKSNNFYRDGKALVKPLIKKNRKGLSMYITHCKNAYCLVYGEDSDIFYIYKHCFRPYFKSAMKEAFEKYKDVILNSVSKFRDEKNMNIYLFDDYQLKIGRSIEEETFSSKSLDAYCTIEEKKHILETYEVIAIQDTTTESFLDIYNDYTLNAWFINKYKQKSNYEINDAQFSNDIKQKTHTEEYLKTKAYVDNALFRGWITEEQAKQMLDKYLK